MAATEALMREAISLAARGPAVDPNPRVGCVLVRDGVVIGRGWHRGAGTPHAEVAALADAGDAAGATAYVTLEPCAHVGRTGACADALAAARVARVVFAQSDPNPIARGGADVLRSHGIEVYAGTLAGEASALNDHWTFSLTHGRPWVSWKFAATLDGYSAAADGSSKWITGPDARADVHRLRATAGAIAAGTGTVLADDPQLTVRAADGEPASQQPLRVIIGEREIPATSRVLDDTAPTVQLHTHDPERVLKELHDRGIHHLFLEGGPTLGAAFVAAGLVDEVVGYIAPKLLGAGSSAVGALGIETLADAVSLRLHDLTRVGDDVRLTYRRK
ncbi:bifunctional diaminohydroxyphosphoribosylaminopyrimidine deaminase/5-amino-6-(5-phosphoribosylamino)uracil reductase RibD [Flexivirga meconopsidis]|uniref:bifunctional diaminohydroxyphosphoribosylaminopyrimidine deaminase/5-amino-6-(5-phosphoribosylamino)uracil reductase RibD n=1 Tax=Flexivirga meconopsidis TaxID=2977121 RepID=UPI00223EC94D|nr:bifunctional diaminohydroxyphosphoribosylaminopyrimidine deaminase/5-amino-6-(5-phosphoribosylamino)uracil reductase RibD [Flexivirga meconopsidis]